LIVIEKETVLRSWPHLDAKTEGFETLDQRLGERREHVGCAIARTRERNPGLVRCCAAKRQFGEKRVLGVVLRDVAEVVPLCLPGRRQPESQYLRLANRRLRNEPAVNTGGASDSRGGSPVADSTADGIVPVSLPPHRATGGKQRSRRRAQPYVGDES
jgi:hypothetical protein